MEISSIVFTTLYFLIGVWCSYKWFREDYEKEYTDTVGDKETHERGLVLILLLLMTTFWPIYVIRKLIKHF